MVCIEGEKDDILHFTQLLRGLPWKKMTSKLQEKETFIVNINNNSCGDDDGSKTLLEYRKFIDFQELNIAAASQGRHIDMGMFLHILEERHLAHVFREVLGIDPSKHTINK